MNENRQEMIDQAVTACQRLMSLFANMESDAAKWLVECRLDCTGFLDEHPQFKHVFAYASPRMYIGLFQYLLETAGYVKTIDWKADAGMCAYALAKCGLPKEIYQQMNLQELNQYDTHAILARIGLLLEKSELRLYQIAPEFDDVFCVGLAPANVLDVLIPAADAAGIHIVCVNSRYIEENHVDLTSLNEKEDRLGIDALYQKEEEGEVHYLLSDVRYSETGLVQLEDTPFGQRLSPQWLEAVLKQYPHVLNALHEGKGKVVLTVVFDQENQPLLFEDPYTRFGKQSKKIKSKGKVPFGFSKS